MAKPPDQLGTTSQQAAHLSRLLSGARLGSYAANVPPGTALTPLDVYVYNMRLAAALLGPLHVLEVVVRNAIHQQLMRLTQREDWWSTLVLDDWQDEKLRKALHDATRDCRRKQRSATADDVIASLDLGFWCGLVGNGRRLDYERALWQPAVRFAFPNNKRGRKGVHQSLDRIRRLRNRVSHHEPIHDRVSVSTYEEIIRMISW